MARFGRIRSMTGDSFVALDDAVAHKLDAAPWQGGEPASGPLVRGAELAPCCPKTVLCVARNYRAHAAELGNDVPAAPMFFMKPASSILDPGGTVLLPPESERVEYEGELAVVLGKRARRVSARDAMSYVFGYTLACDVTARDLQRSDGQWTRAKGFDTFCPLGPTIDTEFAFGEAVLELWVNDEQRQRAPVSDMVFDIPTLIAEASRFTTLHPGDILLTGTPEGVGPLSAGDRVVVKCSGLADLTFSVAKEDA
ncbi:MAG: fumarylacetoacetate hydrolase family protein [Polyangiaceae bacterium]